MCFLIWLGQALDLCALSLLVATWAAPVEVKMVTWEYWVLDFGARACS